MKQLQAQALSVMKPTCVRRTVSYNPGWSGGYADLGHAERAPSKSFEYNRRHCDHCEMSTNEHSVVLNYKASLRFESILRHTQIGAMNR